MNRRGFLKLFGTAAAAAVVAPKCLLPPPPPAPAYTSYLVGKDAIVIGEYADYCSFSDFALETATDPLLVVVEKEMAYRLAMTVSALPAQNLRVA